MSSTRQRLALLLVVSLGVPLLLSSPAEAAGSMTVTPSSGLVELQTVTVTGSGFDPAATLGMCQALSGPPVISSCGANETQLLINESGTFSTTLQVRRFIFVPLVGRTVDCAVESCVIAAADIGNIEATLVTVPISFVPSPPPPATRGSITVTPNTDLVPGQFVTVNGTGFRPNMAVEVLECAPTPSDPTDCNAFVAATAATDDTGAFSAQAQLLSALFLPDGTFLDCPTAPGTCVMAAAEVVDPAGTIVTAPLAFIPPPDEITVTPDANLRNGQTVTVTGSGWGSSESLQVQQCAFATNFICTEPVSFSADTAGNFSISFVVQRRLGETDCAAARDTCEIIVSSTIYTRFAPLEFAPSPHFLCYDVKRTPPRVGAVTAIDQFGTNTVAAERLHLVCNPTNTQDQNPNAPSEPNHLTAYDTNSKRSPATGQRILATDQFGTLRMQLLQNRTLMVPAAASETSPPAPLAMPGDAFVCYRVKTSPFTTVRNVKVEDQFGVREVDLLGVRQFCAPANVNGGQPGAETHAEHLTCYDTKLSKGFDVAPRAVFTNDQFQQKRAALDGSVDMLCVPPTKFEAGTGGSVTGSGTASFFDEFAITAESGRRGANPTGQVMVGGSLPFAGSVTCLEVRGNAATMNVDTPEFGLLTMTVTDGAQSGTPDTIEVSALPRTPTDCSPFSGGITGSVFSGDIAVIPAEQ